MPRPKNPVPLVSAVARAFKAVGKLQRTGYNEARRYPFTRASDVLEAVRERLLSQDIVIHLTEAKPEYTRDVTHTNGGEPITECNLAVTYTFMNALEKMPPMTVNGVGRDVEDKAIYKAQTGAQKALLKRFGLIAEDTDDPEFDGKREPAGETLDDIAPMRQPKKVTPRQTLEPPKPQAVPGQASLPLRTASQPIDLKIGNKTVSFEPKSDRATFSV